MTASRTVTTFLSTVTEVLRRPRAFFRDVEEPIRGSVGFALAIFVPAVLLQLLAAYVLFATDLIDTRLKLEINDLEVFLKLLALATIGAVFFIAYLAAFYQAMSSIAAKTRPEMTQTIRATCFGFAPMILAVVPVIGFFAGLLWSLCLHALALREMHGASWVRAGLAVTAPLVVILLRFVYA